MSSFGFKDFEEVSLKATYNIELGSRTIEEGETLVYFDTIQIAGLSEVKDKVVARGGYNNSGLVYWEKTKELRLQFSQGVFSKEQLALLTNSNLLSNSSSVPISMREYLESNENGVITCKYTPARKIYIYKVSDGSKCTFTQSGKNLTISTSYTDVIVDYEFDYTDGSQILKIGQRLMNGFVSLEGKTRLKDDTTGHVVTGVIKIPKLRLMSDLSIRLGTQASPVSVNFNAIGVPIELKGNSYVSEFHILADDLESSL